MTTTYQLEANELDVSLIESIKAAYKDKKIEIEVFEVSDMDTTEYLLSSPANKEHLLQAIDDIENGRNIIVPDQEQFR
jgi:antitoxin YefM